MLEEMGGVTHEMMHGLMLAARMCRENRDGCRSCRFHGAHTGCMFKRKGYPARWKLEQGRKSECK
ncbi:MAG: hypothetical protein IKH16_13480 [Selenomonadaceae bacterium]|nr:hypothetical protein [Selenomonadaceae bacterium]